MGDSSIPACSQFPSDTGRPLIHILPSAEPSAVTSKSFQFPTLRQINYFHSLFTCASVSLLSLPLPRREGREARVQRARKRKKHEFLSPCGFTERYAAPSVRIKVKQAAPLNKGASREGNYSERCEKISYSFEA